MKVLLAVSCLVAVVLSQESDMQPGAKRGTFLNVMQQQLIATYQELFPDGRRLMNTAQLGIMTAKNDLCKINNEQFQSQNSVILGKTCKKAFVKLYNEEPDRCGGMFCNVVTNAETFLNDTMRALIAAQYDKEFFDIIEENVVAPAMEYSCKCSGKMMDAWMGCKNKIGEADIWYTLMNFGGFDTSADYLGGQDWKTFWVDVVVNQVPWDDMEVMLERTMANLCQRDTDMKGDSKCYSYFYKTFTTLYQWYLKSSGGNPAMKKNERSRGPSAPDHCSTYDFSEFMEMEAEDISFTDIKDAVVDKFCVEDCEDLYQATFLGCCTASMIQDTELEQAVMDTAEGIADIYVAIYPEEEEEAEAGITEYFEYYREAMNMLRNPTCEDSDVSYDVTPCTEGDSSSAGGDEDACAGLSGKQLKICKKKQKKGSKGDKKGGKGKGGKGKGGKGKGGKGGKKGKKGKKGGDEEA